jgi:uncharacterized membrane protein
MEPYLIKELIHTALEIGFDASGWIGWNMFLAIIPLYLSLYLFRSDDSSISWLQNYIPRSSQRLVWTIGVGIFILFLPNAPYILTDVIHLNRYILEYNSRWVTGFIIAPMFVLFLTLGFLAYVLSLINVGYFLQRRGYGRWIPAIELALHGLSAIGVFVGRFPRLNSWYLLTKPGHVIVTLLQTLLSPEGILGILAGFIVITVLYLPFKEVTLAVAADRKKDSRKKRVISVFSE